MMEKNMESSGHWDINMDVHDTRLFRSGDEPPEVNIEVTVGFSREGIAIMGKRPRIKKNSRSIVSTKENIIDWCARAAGALNEAEFYCTGINIDIDDNGEILRGETIFRRRYML